MLATFSGVFMTKVGKYEGPATGAEIGHFLITIEALLLDYLSGVIFEYDKNRAGLKPGGLDLSRVKEIAENFTLTALGAFYVSDQGNGSYMMLDAHHRLAALKLIYQNDPKKFEEFKEVEVPLCVVHKSVEIETYQRLNTSRSHTGVQKVMNSDLLCGSYIKEWETKSGVTILPSNSQSIIDIALTREDMSEFNIEDTWKRRKQTTKLADKAKDRRNYSFSESTTKAIVSGLKILAAIAYQVREDKNYTKNAEQVLKCPGWAQTVLADYASNGQAFGGFTRRDLKKVARKINKDPMTALKYVRTVSRRNLKLLEDKRLIQFLS
jgi:hypothetical protein